MPDGERNAGLMVFMKEMPCLGQIQHSPTASPLNKPRTHAAFAA
jgi:hypothetical protein